MTNSVMDKTSMAMDKTNSGKTKAIKDKDKEDISKNNKVKEILNNSSRQKLRKDRSKV